MDFPFKHATGDHLDLLRPCLQVIQNYQFQFEIVIMEKWTVIEVLFVSVFLLRKNKNKSM